MTRGLSPGQLSKYGVFAKFDSLNPLARRTWSKADSGVRLRAEQADSGAHARLSGYSPDSRGMPRHAHSNPRAEKASACRCIACTDEVKVSDLQLYAGPS